MTYLRSSPDTVIYGRFEPGRAPVLSVPDGARVTVETVSGGPEALPPDGAGVLEEMAAIHAAAPAIVPGHLLTGPIAVEGAEPGDTLRVEIEAVALRQPYGWNAIRPLGGALPNDVAARRMTILPLDLEANVARLPWGDALPLAPFFGVMGTAPPPAWGPVTTIEPRSMGGNIDCKELVAGTVLYLPVHVVGAQFSCGDGHAVQGDGEVCITAIETALTGTFRLSVIKEAVALPRATTPTHEITFGFDPDLDRAAEIALREMIALIRARTGLGFEDAYMLCSLACDLRVTQVVNGHKGVHAMLPRERFAA